MKELIEKVIKINVIIALLMALVFAFMRKFSFSCGILVGSAWSIANALLTIKLIEIAILRKAKNKLLLLLLIKFPVLYLLGFLILIYKVLPIFSLFLGAISILLALGVFSLCQKVKLPSMNCQI